MKTLLWVGSSLNDLRALSQAVRQAIGEELFIVQLGETPADSKPMQNIGAGVREIRVSENNPYRVIYIAKYPEGIYVLHVFEKKTRKTPKADIQKAKKRLSEIQQTRLKT